MTKTKGLTEDGSTRSYREARRRISGKKRCVVCGTTKNLQANHIKPRLQGGTDDPKNLEWRCLKHQTYVGRPRS